MTVPCRNEQAEGLTATSCSFSARTPTAWLRCSENRSSAGAAGNRGPSRTRADDGTLEVSTGPSNSLFRVVDRQEFVNVPPAVVRATATHVLAALSCPLLGVLPSNELMVSFMDRSFEDHAVQVAPVSVRLESRTRSSWFDWLVADLDAIGSDDPWGAFAVRGLPVRLSYPRVVA